MEQGFPIQELYSALPEPEQAFQEGVPLHEAIQPYAVGIDCHSKFIQVCVLVVQEGRVFQYDSSAPTTWPGLCTAADETHALLVKRMGGKPPPRDALAYTIESTGCYHLPVIHAWQGQPSIVNPLLASPSRRKTDKLDAKLLARQALTQLWPPSYMPHGPQATLRCLLLARRYAMKMRNATGNRINNILLRYGITIGREGKITDAVRRPLIEDHFQDPTTNRHPCLPPIRVPDKVVEVVNELYHQWDIRAAEVKELDKRCVAWVKSTRWLCGERLDDGADLLAWLTSAPGIGPVTAVTWLSEVGDPTRFEHPSQLTAFAGCDPSLKVSAGKVTEQKRRKGNTHLHRALVQAAQYLVNRRTEPIGQWGYSLSQRHQKGGWQKAVGAVARRLAQGLYHVHTRGEPFSYRQYRLDTVRLRGDVRVQDLGLSVRTARILLNLQIHTGDDLVRAYYCSLRDARGVGPKMMKEVSECLRNPPPEARK